MKRFLTCLILILLLATTIRGASLAADNGKKQAELQGTIHNQGSRIEDQGNRILDKDEYIKELQDHIKAQEGHTNELEEKVQGIVSKAAGRPVSRANAMLLVTYFPAHAVKPMAKIINCESGWDTQSHLYSDRTKDNSYGLGQINLYGSLANNRPKGEWLLDAENNIKYSAQMYAGQGFTPWSCARKLGIS